ncbi:hypothetical protein [Rhizobium leguminosarum]|jgi:hypothetical protein|uniref:hypothetical protein n=1 Tax=Rhizobium leguminosarum TaxID=384 RepID=UPI002E1307A9|nr:hypothetical protein U8Q02_40570 [Rhizobium leguminosarum]
MSSNSKSELPAVVLLQDLPVVVTGPGDYLTRSGKRVQIREISGKGTFNAKGAVYREFRGRTVARGYDIWHPSGCYRAVGEHGLDIVGPAGGQVAA